LKLNIFNIIEDICSPITKKVLVKTASKTLNTPHKSECSTSNTMEEDDPNEDSNEMQSQPKKTPVS